jgi:hypothetical protein
MSRFLYKFEQKDGTDQSAEYPLMVGLGTFVFRWPTMYMAAYHTSYFDNYTLHMTRVADMDENTAKLFLSLSRELQELAVKLGDTDLSVYQAARAIVHKRTWARDENGGVVVTVGHLPSGSESDYIRQMLREMHGAEVALLTA